MLKSRRFALALGTVGLSAALALVLLTIPEAGGQQGAAVGGKKGKKGDPPPPPPKSDVDAATQYSALRLNENTELQQYLDVADSCIKDSAWADAVQALQIILDHKEDSYAQIKHRDPNTGEEKIRSASVKFAANQMLGDMPADGLNVYEVKYGAPARAMLEDAKKKGDRQLLAEVAQRYMHTRAGIEANDLLATTYLDRGQFFKAALHFKALLSIPETRYKTSDLTVFKAALAYRRAGNVKAADAAWKQLQGRLRTKGGLTINGQLIATARLEKTLTEIPEPVAVNPYDWPRVHGNLTHTAQAKGSTPLLDEVRWRRPLFADKSDENDDLDRGEEAFRVVKRAVDQQLQSPNTPVLPGSFPIAAEGMLLYRTGPGISAVYLHDVKDGKGALLAKAGQIAWKTTDFDSTLGSILSNGDFKATIEGWLTNTYQPSGFLNLVYENSLAGTLCTDQRLVYAIDDLAVPMPPQLHHQQYWNNNQIVPDKLKPLVKGNTLWAFDLQSGKIEWRLPDPQRANDEFENSLFLGPPISIGGKLYVLNEQSNGQLRLVCLDPFNKGAVVGPMQNLGKVLEQHRITHDISRRATAVHLAYGEGVLVCPTNAGQILGVDLLTRSLAWAYPYRQGPPDPRSIVQQGPAVPPQHRQMALSYSNWKVAPPMVQDGKVVFTAPDAASVHCINLRDGVPVWVQPQRENDLFLAGIINNKVLIVGKNSVRALRLADGLPLWSLPTGDLPSGQGVASKNVYYLPLRKGEICAIDLERDIIRAHNAPTKTGGTPPGNLVFYEGAVLSQTPTEVIAYPQLTAKMLAAAEAWKADPTNLHKLFELGDLRLKDGQVAEAVKDLRNLRDSKPPADLLQKTEDRLYDAFTDLLQMDFPNTSGKYLAEYEALTKKPADLSQRQRREATYLRILGQGREQEGDLVAAFLAYRQFGSLPINRDGIPSVEDPLQKTPTSVWLRGRVMGMLARAKANPEQLKPLEAKIEQEWTEVKAKNDVGAIRSFVGMFDTPFKVGREARLQLAEAILKTQTKDALLEAELNLEQLRTPGWRDDPAIGGRALEALARLEQSKNTEQAAQAAAAHYRKLGRDFAKIVIRDGKTGAKLLEEAYGNPILRGFLDETAARWDTTKLRVREIPLTTNLSKGLQGHFIFQPAGELTPFLERHRLFLNPVNSSNPELKLVDMTTNHVRWKCQLGDGPHNYNFFRHLYDQAEKNTAYFPNARFRFFHTAGHLAVFQVGTMVYGLDMDNAKLLWQHCLVDPVLPFNTQVMPDEQGVLWVTTRNQFGQIASRKKVGHLGTVQPSYVALTSSKGLVVLDPLRGNVMWTKPNISPSAEVFGDDQYLYLVEATDAGDLGVGRVLRASDGQPVAETKDFSYLYRSRLRVLGGHLLAADKAGGQLTLRLYDVRAGKDLWSKTFDSSARVLATEDPYLAGVIEPDGKLTVVDLKARAVALTASVMNGRVSEEDIKGLREPLLLRDNDLYYVALNQAVDANKVGGGVLANNFGNGLRCRLVNGWVLAFDQKGEFQWHTHDRVSNQMVVLEQFEQLPILLFSVRYTEKIQGGIRGERMVAYTGSVDKKTGKAIWWPLDPRPNNGVAQFFGFNLDARLGTINLVGYSGVLQHYLDDGRGPPTEAGGTPGGIKGSDLVPPVLPPNDRPPPPNIKPGPAVKPVIKGKGVKPIKKEAQPLPLRVPPGMQPPLPAEVLPLELPRRSNEGVVPQKK